MKDGGRRKKKGGSDEDKIEACIPATAESATPGTAKKERGGMKRRLRRISVTAIGFESALGPDGVQGEPEPEPERDPSELQVGFLAMLYALIAGMRPPGHITDSYWAWSFPAGQ